LTSFFLRKYSKKNIIGRGTVHLHPGAAAGAAVLYVPVYYNIYHDTAGNTLNYNFMLLFLII
jgi:hypothetical protein